jgi:glutaredoxin 3
MNQVKIVTSPTCSYCHAAKDLLKREGISYQEVDVVDDSEQAKQLLAESGQRTIPQIFIDDKSIGGFSELSKVISSSEFDLTQAQLI